MSTFLIADEATLTDGMRRVQAGDRAAYEFVLDQCRDAFASLALERCPAGASEDELVRQCLLTLHYARHTFDPRRSFLAWIEAIARHHGIGPDPVDACDGWCARIGRLLDDLRRWSRRAAFETKSGEAPGHREGAPET